jgi:hypothetical protein
MPACAPGTAHHKTLAALRSGGNLNGQGLALRVSAGSLAARARAVHKKTTTLTVGAGHALSSQLGSPLQRPDARAALTEPWELRQVKATSIARLAAPLSREAERAGAAQRGLSERELQTVASVCPGSGDSIDDAEELVEHAAEDLCPGCARLDLEHLDRPSRIVGGPAAWIPQDIIGLHERLEPNGRFRIPRVAIGVVRAG